MLRAMLLLVMASLFPAGVAVAGDMAVRWTLVQDESGPCLIASDYAVAGRPDVEAAVAMALSDDLTEFQISFTRSDYSLVLGATYDVDLSIDRRWQGRGIVDILSPEMFGVAVPVSREFLDALMNGATLQVHGRTSRVSIALTGTRRAIPALIGCTTRSGRADRGTNPFGSSDGPGARM